MNKWVKGKTRRNDGWGRYQFQPKYSVFLEDTLMLIPQDSRIDGSRYWMNQITFDHHENIPHRIFYLTKYPSRESKRGQPFPQDTL